MENGFIRDMQDVKILILYVTSLLDTAEDAQTIYELCYVDNRLTYFDVYEALPQMVETGHLEVDETGRYKITEKGRDNIEVTADSVAFTIRVNASRTVEAFKESRKNQAVISTEIKELDGSYFAMAEVHDRTGKLFGIELAAPDRRQAKKLCDVLNGNAARLYELIMQDLMEEMPE